MAQTRRKKLLTRSDWMLATRRLLISVGIEGVNVNRIARRMNVTRGSFYWHFRNKGELLKAVLGDWEDQNRREMSQVRNRWKLRPGDHSEIVRLWMTEDPSYPTFDVAIRFWSRSSNQVARVVADIDAEWIALLKNMFETSGYGETQSLVRARIYYFHQIGYYALDLKEDRDERVHLYPFYHEVLVGGTISKDLERTLADLSEAHTTSPKRK